MAASARRPGFIPALRFERLTGLYDPLVRLTTREVVFKRALLEQASLERARTVLDVGCGTGTLAIMVARAAPDAIVSGVDGDPAILRRARSKAAEAGVRVTLSEGLATALPYEDSCFDRVLSTLLLHHLADEQKTAAAAEIARVLAPGGELHVADWGAAQDPLMRGAFLLVQALDGFATTSANVGGRLPELLAAGGLQDVRVTRRLRTPLGTIELLRARGARPSQVAVARDARRS